MANKIVGMGTIFIDGNELLKIIDAFTSKEIPVDKMWISGLKYSKRIIKTMMGLEQEEDRMKTPQEVKTW